MTVAAAIIVEGGSDDCFVRQYFGHLAPGFATRLVDRDEIKNPANADKIVVCTTGKENKKNGGVPPLIGEKLPSHLLSVFDNSKKVFYVVDADDKPAKRRAELLATAQRSGAEVAGVFLLPNDTNEGTLEDLLESISADRGVYECFEQYEECLRGKNSEYKQPGMKAKIYAYWKARGAKTRRKAFGANPCDRERNYSDENIWDLESPALQPLRDFFLRHFSDI